MTTIPLLWNCHSIMLKEAWVCESSHDCANLPQPVVPSWADVNLPGHECILGVALAAAVAASAA
eukprot:CAMPEP_0172854200 /NCGR_PEP_ID=MMETSP1075-20121228/57608_1 /TAXON_ID=2916 /ORGANISM="Ceratium fusus, Strain PA161109" /LENGTH=63 /DNA_ID=CAMNT_0013700821 /DNA_START=23 /DNA_END=210 /DNA_ORIENTATION=+